MKYIPVLKAGVPILTYLLTYLLTPWCGVLLEKITGLQLVKKFPAFLWNPKVNYRTHKRPLPVPILGQPDPVHIPTSHLLEIYPNIIHPSTPGSPQWSLSLWRRTNTTSKYITSFENKRQNISEFLLKLITYIVKMVNKRWRITKLFQPKK